MGDYLVERHQIKGNDEIVALCSLAKELYNRCNYLMRLVYFRNKNNKINKERFPDINVLNDETKFLDCYINLGNTKLAKQVIRSVLTDWSNYRKSLTAFYKNPKKFFKQPKPPHYKKKLSQLIFYSETIRRKPLLMNMIIPTNDIFSVESGINFKQVILTPKSFGFVVDIQYEIIKTKLRTNNNKKQLKNFCAIDIGLNNLCAITSNQHDPIRINGRIMKSFNYNYNLNNKSKHSLEKRYWRLENYFHHVSKFIIKNCQKYNITTIIIGKNNGWKNGKRKNFKDVPYDSLFEKIKYKAEMNGIEVIFVEESYTSKASFIDKDELPVYEKRKKNEKSPHHNFSGKRIKRGLYRTKSGLLINADCNGSGNIFRKAFPDSIVDAKLDRSVAETPLKVNPLRSFASGKTPAKAGYSKLIIPNSMDEVFGYQGFNFIK